MRFLNIDVPDAIIRSARADRLVVFVGAGASFEEPSLLPGFWDLALRIAQGTGEQPIILEREEEPASAQADVDEGAELGGGKDSRRTIIKKEEPLDRFLGRIESRFGVDLYSRTNQLLRKQWDRRTRTETETESKPNRIHRAIVKLFGDSSPIRIVTTNFDMHLEGALDALGRKRPEIYRAPALPMGNSFEGIVYVHGRLDPKPEEIVITDRDFGRAYLTEGWARRFLSQLFAEYDVFFIGYSHDDPVVSYLARGLPPTSERTRFALTVKGRSNHWKLLGIEPVEFPNANGDFSEVGDLLEELASFLNRGTTAHEKHLKQLLAPNPGDGDQPTRPGDGDQPTRDLKAEDRDYLLFVLSEKTLRKAFFRHAEAPEWIEWMDSVHQLDTLFSSDCDDRDLIFWFVQGALDGRGTSALQVLSQRPRYSLSRTLQIEISRRIWIDTKKNSSSGKLDNEKGRQLMLWTSVLAADQRLDPTAAQLLGNLAKDLPFTAQTTTLHLSIFELITRPFPELRRPFLASDQKELQLETSYPADRHSIRSLWKNVFQPNLKTLAGGLLPILTANLLASRRLIEGAGQATVDFDPESMGRSAIEPHDQDNRHSVLDALIDAARDSLAFLNEDQPKKARRTIEEWISSESLLLRRVAVHGIQGHEGLSPNQAFQLIRKVPGLLRESYAHHELLHTLRFLYARGNERLRRRILNEKKRALSEYYEEGSRWDNVGPEELDAWEENEWETFLRWLGEQVEDCGSLRERLEDVGAVPAGVGKEHPDFHVWHSSYSVQPAPPITVDDLLRMSPQEVLGFEIEVSQRTSKPGIDELAGLRLKISEAADINFDWGFRFAEYLATPEHLQREDLWNALFEAWRKANPTDQQQLQLLGFLTERESLLKAAQRRVASYLQDRFQSGGPKITKEISDAAIRLAVKLWPLLDQSYRAILSGGDLLTEALNNPIGDLAQFAVSSLSRQKNDFKKGLTDNPQLLALFDFIARDARPGAESGAIILGMQFPFLMAVAPDWSRDKLIPLIDWNSSPRVACAVWTGYFWSRTRVPLEGETAVSLQQLFEHLDLFDERARRQIPKYLIALLNHDETSLGSDWFSAFLLQASDEDRALFWQQLDHAYGRERETPEEENRLDHIWTHWAKSLVQRRLNGAPSLETSEWKSIFSLGAHLDEHFPEFVDIVCDREQGMEFQHGPDYLMRLGSEDEKFSGYRHLWKHPTALAQYLIRTMAEAIPPWFLAELATAIRKLIASGEISPDLEKKLRDRYVALGGSFEDLEDQDDD